MQQVFLLLRLMTLKKSLADNIENPAMFLKGFEYVMSQGCKLFSEFGSKKVLSGLASKIISDRKLDGVHVEGSLN